MRQSGLFGLSDHMKRLSADGDPLEVLAQVVNLKCFGRHWWQRWSMWMEPIQSGGHAQGACVGRAEQRVGHAHGVADP